MTHYIGSGPYCYANSLAMTLGASAPPPAVIEVLTGSPFGFELLGGTLPLFDPYGWDPDHGLDAAIALLGTRCTRTAGARPGRPRSGFGRPSPVVPRWSAPSTWGCSSISRALPAPTVVTTSSPCRPSTATPWSSTTRTAIPMPRFP